MPIDLPPQYDPKSVEKAIYQKWLDARAFHAVPETGPRDTWKKHPYSIVIPPPNVTGALHLGHAINGTIQDILTRYHRMKGDNTMLMPGIDHAGIATQAVVEKTIFEKEKKTRHDLGREELVKRIWEWKEQFGTRILSQLQSIGASCDWDRTRFTLDEVCAKAVREAFFKMFKDGLIFRGKRLVNWDTHLQTAVADDEIYHETVKGQLTSIKYPVAPADNSELCTLNSEFLVVATTRPETMLGDTAVAVHPDDPRYTHLHGKHVIVPLVGRKIPIITDGLLVDPKFGTGVVKVTPAHDPNDYATGQRHNLEQINLLTPDGKVNDNGQGEFLGKKYSYVGLKFATAARKQVLEDLEALGLIADKKPHEHEVGHSDRSKTPIEPYLSDQWFVRMGDVVETRPSETRPSGSVASKSDDPSLATQTLPNGRVSDIPPHSNALAYFITFHTYATWLHGQEPGSVDPKHNTPDTPFIPPDSKLLDRDITKMAHPPVELTLLQRQSLVNTIQEVAAHRGWVLYAINARTTHVHVVVAGNHAPERMMNDFKSYATRRMKEAGLLSDETKVWSRHGSTRYLWKSEHVSGAVRYTLHEQGENALGTVYERSSETRPLGSVVSKSSDPSVAHQTLPNGRVSEGVTLADGSRAPGLAQAAMDALTSGRVKITPERYAKGYLDWLGQKRDWCISRQLWWGHRIPVWRGPAHQDFMRPTKVGDRFTYICNEVEIAVEHREENGTEVYYYCIPHGHQELERAFEKEGFVQDPDVLDTWFSSALWPISTMGWPNDPIENRKSKIENLPEPALLDYFYPTSLLSTAREILTLWVARMVIFGLYCRGDVPFRDVYIHAVIQDGEGRPMKKTLGNGVDPVDIVHSHGADALRFTLAAMATETQDIRLPVQLVCPHCHERLPNNINGPVVIGCPKCKKHLTRPVQTAVATAEAPMSHSTSDRFDLGRNFANKIWNATRFILGNLGDATPAPGGIPGPADLGTPGTLEDRWILSRLQQTIRAADSAINSYRFADLAEALRTFFWTDLCDWYLEIAKARIKAGDAQVQSLLLHCLRTTLKLLHPVMPFITEELWSKLPRDTQLPITNYQLLVTVPWPTADDSLIDKAAEQQIALAQAITSAIREIQNRYPAAKSKDVVLAPRDAAMQQLIERSRSIIEPLAGAKIAANAPHAAKPEKAATTVLPDGAGCEIFIGGVIDTGAEIPKLTKRKAELEKFITAGKAKLANEAAIAKVPPNVAQGWRSQLAKQEEELAAIIKNLAELQG